MSEPATALRGALSDTGIAMISEMPLQGMITLRGDLSLDVIKNTATSATGVEMPGPREARVAENRGICWMSPDELLILCAYDAVTAKVAQMNKALGDTHALVVNVSDARAGFRISGAFAREVMGKTCPVDFAQEAFKPGMFRRTRMAQVPAVIWMPDEETFQIVCFRSQAQYAFDVLTVSAQQGSNVDLY